jgi:hypothetical protein
MYIEPPQSAPGFVGGGIIHPPPTWVAIIAHMYKASPGILAFIHLHCHWKDNVLSIQDNKHSRSTPPTAWKVSYAAVPGRIGRMPDRLPTASSHGLTPHLRFERPRPFKCSGTDLLGVSGITGGFETKHPRPGMYLYMRTIRFTCTSERNRKQRGALCQIKNGSIHKPKSSVQRHASHVQRRIAAGL